MLSPNSIYHVNKGQNNVFNLFWVLKTFKTFANLSTFCAWSDWQRSMPQLTMFSHHGNRGIPKNSKYILKTCSRLLSKISLLFETIITAKYAYKKCLASIERCLEGVDNVFIQYFSFTVQTGWFKPKLFITTININVWQRDIIVKIQGGAKLSAGTITTTRLNVFYHRFCCHGRFRNKCFWSDNTLQIVSPFQ